MAGPGAIGSGPGTAGQSASLGAALSCLHRLHWKRFSMTGVSPLEAATGQVTLSTMLILPIMPIVDRLWCCLPSPDRPQAQHDGPLLRFLRRAK